MPFFIPARTVRGKTSLLKQLLADIQAERVSDPDDELLGTLLSWLYPQNLSASQVWNYLSEPRDSDLAGSYVQFWDYGLLEKSSDKDVLQLLDGLQSLPSGLPPALETPYLENLPLKLLARGLKAYGDKITPEQLYDWLGVGLPVTQYKFGEEARNVQVWLEQHPAIQKAILTEGIQRYAEPDDESFNGYMYEVEQRLYKANLPSDFGAWCLEQAMAVTDSQAVEYFITLASRVDLSLETQLEQARGHGEVQNLISKMIAQREQEKIKIRELRRGDQSYIKEEGAKRK